MPHNQPPTKQNTMPHPSEKITGDYSGVPIGDLWNVAQELHIACLDNIGTRDEHKTAELVYLAGRAFSESISALADTFEIDVHEVSDAMSNPGDHPELAARINNLVDGLAEVPQ